MVDWFVGLISDCMLGWLYCYRLLVLLYWFCLDCSLVLGNNVGFDECICYECCILLCWLCLIWLWFVLGMGYGSVGGFCCFWGSCLVSF